MELLKLKIEQRFGDGSVDKNASHRSTKEQISDPQSPEEPGKHGGGLSFPGWEGWDWVPQASWLARLTEPMAFWVQQETPSH